MKRGIRHQAAVSFAMILTAVLAGLKSFSAITQWVHDLPDEFMKQLGVSPHKKPSYATIRRLLIGVDADELDKKIGEWTARQFGNDFALEGIALDGKTLRGSQKGAGKRVHLVSAVLHSKGEVLAQTQVPEKTNEIKAVQPTLSDLNIEGAIVTGDAMFTQTEIAKYLVEEKKADYVLDVKDNQPNLRKAILDMSLEQSFFPSAHRDHTRARANGDPQDLG
jgi:predicted transposase YbfD/YdcC